MIIELPQVGESVTEGVIGKWLKSVGERVERFDPLVEVVTDKVSMEMPAPAAGTLTAILAPEGDTVPMGAPIAEIDADDESAADASAPLPGVDAERRIGSLLEDIAPVGPTGSGGPISSSPPAPASDSPASAPPPAAAARTGGGRARRRRYSPAVLRLAAERGIDLEAVVGSGRNGRVTLKDVRAFAAGQPAQPPPAAPAPQAADDERVPLSAVRRIIAANMARSAAEIPQAWTFVEADVSGLVARRQELRDDFRKREGVNLTYLPFVIEAVAASLRENPLLNSSWDDDAIIHKRRIHIGIAAAAPGGLVVPVIHDADAMSVSDLARKLDDLTTRARGGALRLEDIEGGTFTLNNTGALDSILSQPLVNPPQAAILTTEAIVRRPVVVGDGIAIRSMMNLCMSFDHRIMDGAEASAFVNAVKSRLESVGPETSVH